MPRETRMAAPVSFIRPGQLHPLVRPSPRSVALPFNSPLVLPTGDRPATKVPDTVITPHPIALLGRVDLEYVRWRNRVLLPGRPIDLGLDERWPTAKLEAGDIVEQVIVLVICLRWNGGWNVL